MSFENSKQTIFTGTQLDYEEIVEIPEGYEKAELKDFEDGTLIRGRPEMASVSSFTFDDDGEEKTVNRFKLYIFQDADKIYVEINVNLKNDGDIHKNVRKGNRAQRSLETGRHRNGTYDVGYGDLYPHPQPQSLCCIKRI